MTHIRQRHFEQQWSGPHVGNGVDLCFDWIYSKAVAEIFEPLRATNIPNAGGIKVSDRMILAQLRKYRVCHVVYTSRMVAMSLASTLGWKSCFAFTIKSIHKCPDTFCIY